MTSSIQKELAVTMDVALIKNDDELRKSIAVRAYADRAYPFDIL